MMERGGILSGMEMVIGLEVHVELKTRTKIFCGCGTRFDAPPNTQCCPVCMGLPGSLPVLNKEVVELAMRAGLATNCHIANDSKQDRKNYFYPDLPKAYQISQYDRPLCAGGWLDVEAGEEALSGVRRIGITRIHIEEDAGKLIHDASGTTRIDLNRCGVPLIELVTEPDLRSAAEAKAFLRKLRAILITCGVSDCRMNEGSMRCDVNLSIRKQGDMALGTRTETKNLNSFAFVGKAIEYEFRRQVEALAAGEAIVQETRRFDPSTGKTYAMRAKENADDYRYFPDPDLPPIHLTGDSIERVRRSLPELPDAKTLRFQNMYGISASDAAALCGRPPLAEAFDQAAPLCREPMRLGNLMVGELPRLAPEEDDMDGAVPVTPAHLAELSDMMTEGVIHMGAARRVLQELAAQGIGEAIPPAAIVARLGLAQISDPEEIKAAVRAALLENEALARTYLGGKEKAIQAIMGKVMGKLGGRGNPGIASAILRGELERMRGEE